MKPLLQLCDMIPLFMYLPIQVLTPAPPFVKFNLEFREGGPFLSQLLIELKRPARSCFNVSLERCDVVSQSS